MEIRIKLQTHLTMITIPFIIGGLLYVLYAQLRKQVQ